MNTFEWEDGTVVERPYVEIDGVKHYVQDGTIDGGTPVSSTNLNEMQRIINSNFEDTITNITVDSNGWTVIEHDNYIEYLKKGTATRQMTANFWIRLNVSNLPVGFENLGNAFLTGSVVGNDGALNCSLGGEPSGSPILFLQVYNSYDGTINGIFYWNARILKLK